jgi:CxxC motif-containing protein (DUF1111 family)
MKNLCYPLLFIFLVACSPRRDVYLASLEVGEQYPGGAATTDDFSMNAFGHVAPNLKDGKEMEFVTGNAFFKRNWVTSPSSTADLDGLGPLFNARSCSSCHEFDGKGTPPSAENEDPVALLFRLSVLDASQSIAEEPSYGRQFNHLSIMGVKPEGKVKVSYEEIAIQYADGSSTSIRKPAYKFEDLQYGKFAVGTMVSPRIAPHIVGLGLLEAISEADLRALADEMDVDGDGISGKMNYIWDVEKKQLAPGRFGWKANQPTVKQQVASAFVGDIGITSSLFPNEACAENQVDCQEAYKEEQPELKDNILQRVTLYSQTLAVPMRRNFDTDSILKGKQLFIALDCNSCHNASFVTGSHPGLPEFANQKIYPYTDLLLHDMGEGLADNRPDGLASGSEWKTPPLWGIGLSETVNGHSYLLHDGRARNVEEAILWHGGEASASTAAFKKLEQQDRIYLIDFINSL